MLVVVALALLCLAACRAPAFEGANERGGIVRVWHGTTEHEILGQSRRQRVPAQ